MPIPRRYKMPEEYDAMPLGLYIKLPIGVEDYPINWTGLNAKSELDCDTLQAVYGPIELYPELYRKG